MAKKEETRGIDEAAAGKITAAVTRTGSNTAAN